MAKLENKRLREEAGGTFLDPQNCGSTVQWAVGAELQSGYRKADEDKFVAAVVYGQIAMTDCNRRIEWSLSDEFALSKLDRAIAALKAARKALRRAEKIAKGYHFPEEE